MTEVTDRPDEESSGEAKASSRAQLMRGLAVVPAVLLLVVAGRAWLGDGDADDDGILSAHGGPGSVAFADLTRAPEYWGTFGSFLLCTEDAVEVELTGFRFETTVEPRDLHVGVRTITPRQARKADVDGGVEPIGSQRGRPLDFVDRGRSAPQPGSYRRGVAGVEVVTDCADVSAFGSPEMAAPMQELLVTARTGPPGAYISALELDYEADGASHTLRLDTDLAFCGSRVTVCD